MSEGVSVTAVDHEYGATSQVDIRRMLRSPAFWEQRTLQPVTRLLLVIIVGVLLCIAIGFIVGNGKFTRHDLLAVVLYLGLAAFAWHPLTAAVIVMLISCVGVVFTNSGGDLLELAIALSLVAATCVPWMIFVYVTLLGVLTTYLAVGSTTLAAGGVYSIAGIAVIAFLAGVAVRYSAARESTLIAERARVAKDLEAIAREDQERIADELHDGIAHDLTMILFHARALPRQPDEAARLVSLTTIEDSAEQALTSIQSLLSLMRDSRKEDLEIRSGRYHGDVVEAVAMLGTLLHEAGIPVRVSSPSNPMEIASATEQILVETVIEAVTNIIKHAPRSKSASIELRAHADAVDLHVTNTFSIASRQPGFSGGRGLRRAEQRLVQVAGRLRSEPTSDGWSLHATVPLGARA